MKGQSQIMNWGESTFPNATKATITAALARTKRSRLASLPGQPPADARLVCLDTETTGLGTAAGTLAFLVGLGWWEGDRFRQVQLRRHEDSSLLGQRGGEGGELSEEDAVGLLPVQDHATDHGATAQVDL